MNRIGQVASQITVLGAEFERATSLAEGYADVLGSARLAAALDRYATTAKALGTDPADG